MREIKFRAWAKPTKKEPGEMFEVISLNNVAVSGRGGSVALEDCILMQFTGLKDKNGKEIYEGDILEEDKSGRRSAVRWDFKSLGRLSEVLNRATVIGNIYENPELLAHPRR